MTIEHTKTVEQATFYSPLADFEEDTLDVEVRTDPLTGRQTRVAEQVFPAPEEAPDIEEFVSDDEGCFFCPEMVHDATPEYPDFVGQDRIESGEAVSFPNLFPYGKHSNVVVLTEDHFRPIDALSESHFEDGLACAFEYLGAVLDHDDPDFASVNMNLLPSSGSSVVHPHLQAVADDHGTNAQRRRLEAEREFHDEHGRSYWEELLEAEKGGPRYVGSTGEVEWLAPFAPMHHWHVRGVTDHTEFPSSDDAILSDLADGITNVLEYYASLDLNAHNFAISLTNDEPASPVIIDIVARTPFDEHYVSDAFFFRTLHDEPAIDVPPEEYATEMTGHF